MPEQNNTTGFPDENVSPEIKEGKDWLLQWCRAIYNAYGDTPINSIGWKSRDRYEMIKTYANGRQTIDKYKKMYVPGQDPSNNRMVTDWTVMPIIPKYRGIALEKIDQQDYYVEINPIDPLARNEVERYLLDIRARLQLKEQLYQRGLQQYQQAAPLQMEQGEPEDLDGLSAMELGIRHRTAMEVEQAVELVMNGNQMNRIRQQYGEDLFDYGVAFLKDERVGNMIKVRRCDPRRMILNFCTYTDFSDLKYIGELRQMLVSQIVFDSQGVLAQEDIEKLYRMGNFNTGGFGVPMPFYGYSGWSDFWSRGKMYVLDVEIYSTDTLEREERINGRGNIRFEKPVFGDDRRARRERNGAKFRRKPVQSVYRAKWVVGTDIIYDYGRQYNMKRDPQNEARVIGSYHVAACSFHDMLAYSRTESLIGYADAIQLAKAKLQHTLNTVVPRGYQINLDTIESVALEAGGASMSPKQILDLFWERGILLTRSINIPGGGTQNQPAVIPLEGGVGSEIAEFWTTIQNNIELIRATLGLNELTDGSSPNPKTLTTIANLAATGTNNALGDLFRCDRNLVESLTKSLIVRIQDIIKTSGAQQFVDALGNGTVTILRNIADAAQYIYQVEIKDLPDAEEIQMLNEQIKIAQEAGQITVADVVRLAGIKNLKQKEMFLAYVVKKNLQQQQQDKAADVQNNAQAQMQSAQAAEQMKQQTLELEFQLKSQLSMQEHQQKMQELAAQGQYRLEEERIASTGRVEASFVQAKGRDEANMRDNTTKLIDKDKADHVGVVNIPADLQSRVEPETANNQPLDLDIPDMSRFSFLGGSAMPASQPEDEQAEEQLQPQDSAAQIY